MFIQLIIILIIESPGKKQMPHSNGAIERKKFNRLSTRVEAGEESSPNDDDTPVASNVGSGTILWKDESWERKAPAPIQPTLFINLTSLLQAARARWDEVSKNFIACFRNF